MIITPGPDRTDWHFADLHQQTTNNTRDRDHTQLEQEILLLLLELAGGFKEGASRLHSRLRLKRNAKKKLSANENVVQIDRDQGPPYECRCQCLDTAVVTVKSCVVSSVTQVTDWHSGVLT
eukprot:2938721-Rhodomonas_salina.1